MTTTTDRVAGLSDGMAVKAPCRVATIATLASLSGLLTIDGVTLAANDRVLVKDQSDARQNGIYNAATGNWSRAKDFDGNRDVLHGTRVYAFAGSSQNAAEYVVTTADPIVIGTSNIVFQARTVGTTVVETPDVIEDLEGTDPDYVIARGYNGKGRGGGWLVYDPSSSKTVDNGKTFAAPSGIGRFTRLETRGFLTTDEFGIKNDMSAGQAARFQTFLNTCWAEKCAAVISANTSDQGIDCEDATIFLNATGARVGSGVNGIRMYGQHQRYSRLSRCMLSVGQVFGHGGAADTSGKSIFGGWYHEGAIHFWSVEGAWHIHDLRVLPVTGLTPSYATDPDLGGAIIDWNYALIAYSCNHPQIKRVRIEANPNVKGVFLDGNSNLQWDGGGVNGCLAGIAAGELGLPFSQAGRTLRLVNLHFESVIRECIAVEYVDVVEVSGDFREESTNNGSYPLMRFGNSAVSGSGPSSVTIEPSHVNGTSGLGTGIDFQRVSVATVKDGVRVSNWVTGIKIGSLATQVNVADGVKFVGNTTDVDRDTAATRQTPVPAMVKPGTLSTGASVTWDATKRRTMYLPLTSSGRTMNNPTGVVEGETYELTITKTNSGDSITSWGSMFRFTGAVPDFASMAVTEHAQLTLRCRVVNGATYLYVDYDIKTVDPWDPSDLGSALKAWWNADDHGGANMTDDGGGLISAWVDRTGSMSLTAATTARPTYGATAFLGSKKGLTFDGVANCLAGSSLGTLPTGSTAGEMWGLVVNTGLVASCLAAYGSGAGSATRRLGLSGTQLLRVSDVTVNLDGPAATAPSAFGGAWNGTSMTGRANGADFAGNPATIASLNTAATRMRIGATATTSASAFFAGTLRHLLVTTTLATADQQKLDAWLLWDCGQQALLPTSHPYYYAPPAAP